MALCIVDWTVSIAVGVGFDPFALDAVFEEGLAVEEGLGFLVVLEEEDGADRFTMMSRSRRFWKTSGGCERSHWMDWVYVAIYKSRIAGQGWFCKTGSAM